MNITQLSDGAWFLDVRLWLHGREYRQRGTFTGGKKTAQERYGQIKAELKQEARAGRSLKVGVTFGEVLQHYRERAEIDTKSMCYLDRLRDELGTIPITELRERFDRWHFFMRQSKSENTGRPYSNQTMNHYLKWARAALNHGVRYGLIKNNPLQYMKPLSTIPRDRMLTEDEITRLLAAVEAGAPHILPIVRYALLVPSRRGELVTLRRGDYDMINNTITIPAERTKMKRPCIKPVPDCMKDYFRNVPV